MLQTNWRCYFLCFPDNCLVNLMLEVLRNAFTSLALIIHNIRKYFYEYRILKFSMKLVLHIYGSPRNLTAWSLFSAQQDLLFGFIYYCSRLSCAGSRTFCLYLWTLTLFTEVSYVLLTRVSLDKTQDQRHMLTSFQD